MVPQSSVRERALGSGTCTRLVFLLELVFFKIVVLLEGLPIIMGKTVRVGRRTIEKD